MRAAMFQLSALCWCVAVICVGPGCASLNLAEQNLVFHEVFYLTNRRESPAENPGDRYNGERGSPAYGVAIVRLDPDKVFTSFARPQPSHVLKQNQSIHEDNVQQVVQEDEDVLVGQLKSYSQNGKPPNEVLIYLHGYKKDFARSLTNAAQLRHELAFPGPVIAFSWPSNNSFAGYLSDMENVEWSEPLLRHLLRTVSENLPGTRIHVIAHSLGNRALFESLIQLSEDRDFLESWPFGEIVFMAPDYDKARFVEETSLQMQRIPSRISLYVSARDFPLMTAAQVYMYPRLGDSRDGAPVLKGIETIDVSDAISITSGHGYYEESPIVIEDLYHLIKQGMGACERPNMKEMQTPAGSYWRLQPAEEQQPEE